MVPDVSALVILTSCILSGSSAFSLILNLLVGSNVNALNMRLVPPPGRTTATTHSFASAPSKAAPPRQQGISRHSSPAHKCTMDGSSFRTEVDIPTWPEHEQMGYRDSFFLLGSCFSDNVGERLRRAKLEAAINPSHGLLFSPLSAASSLDRMISGTPYGEDELGVVFSEGKGLWNSLDHHSTFSSTSRLVGLLNKVLA